MLHLQVSQGPRLSPFGLAVLANCETNIYIYIYIYILYVYIYIYVDRSLSLSLYIYIYIFVISFQISIYSRLTRPLARRSPKAWPTGGLTAARRQARAGRRWPARPALSPDSLNTYIYIYMYMILIISLSLSLYIYIYAYMHTYIT